MFGDFYERFETILACLTKRLGGRNFVVEQRRKAILEFFHYCVIFAETGYRDHNAALAHVAGYFQHCADAMDRLLAEPITTDALTQQVCNDVDAVWQILACALLQAESALTTNNSEQAGVECCAALQHIFQWTECGHLRAHIYIRTQEKVNDGLLGHERADFLTAVHGCLQEVVQ